MAEDKEKQPSRLARAWRSLTRERVLAEMGPLYLARSPWPHMLIGWALAAVAIYMILSARPLFPLEDTEALGIWFSPGFLIALAVVIGLLFSIRFKFWRQGRLSLQHPAVGSDAFCCLLYGRISEWLRSLRARAGDRFSEHRRLCAVYLFPRGLRQLSLGWWSLAPGCSMCSL